MNEKIPIKFRGRTIYAHPYHAFDIARHYAELYPGEQIRIGSMLRLECITPKPFTAELSEDLWQ